MKIYQIMLILSIILSSILSTASAKEIVSFISRLDSDLALEDTYGQYYEKYKLTENILTSEYVTNKTLKELSHDEVIVKKTEPPARKWISNGRQFGKWWLKRYSSYAPCDSLLYYFKLKYSFNELTGNEELKKDKVKSTLILRKNILTNQIDYTLKKKKMAYRGSLIETDKQKFTYSLFIETLKFVDFLMGYQWHKDDKKYYLNLFRYYGGTYFTLLDNKRIIFKIGGYFGHERIDYMNSVSEMLKKYKNPFDEDFFACNNKCTVFITDQITFTQNIKYQNYLKESYYYFESTSELDFKISKHISLGLEYEFTHDSNEIQSLKIGNVKKDDTDFTMSINVNF